MICAHPNCTTEVNPESTTGVCRDHIHKKACQCSQCVGFPRHHFRVRSREELVQMGLLPRRWCEAGRRLGLP